jgi:propanol-preferring alcohol dehydrogenase
MKAMVLNTICSLREIKHPLQLVEIPMPVPADHEILVRVAACGVCHTELDEIEGRTPPPHLPVIPGHQVVGVVEKLGPEATRFKMGERVACWYCLDLFSLW